MHRQRFLCSTCFFGRKFQFPHKNIENLRNTCRSSLHFKYFRLIFSNLDKKKSCTQNVKSTWPFGTLKCFRCPSIISKMLQFPIFWKLLQAKLERFIIHIGRIYESRSYFSIRFACWKELVQPLIELMPRSMAKINWFCPWFPLTVKNKTDEIEIHFLFHTVILKLSAFVLR